MFNPFRNIKLINLIFKIEKEEPNDFTFGGKIRRVLQLNREKKEIREEEFLKSKSKK